jgi:Asp-tRNA(Asn)/Glu-tRNA(Gln) amidotransferase A subunit family amidase
MAQNTNIVDATIDELQAALEAGILTSVDLVARYLRRISAYDCRGVALNSIPIINEAVFEEAADSDDRRAAGGLTARPLEGLPYTVKDSYKVRGMTVACGSPAFKDLIANDDAFTVSAIREAGGVLLGRTNMPPMAYGGMNRGIYGRADSPYNPEYLAAAFWSGSSNGSAVSTAASFAAFGMGEETVSSGRSPASNNALVAYTPSRGWISIRGNWPLYPTCDVIVPHTRTMQDLLRLLKVIAIDDPVTQGDFWRQQPFVELEKPWSKGHVSFSDIEQHTTLAGLRIAVPSMYIGGPMPGGAKHVTVCEEVVELWEQARRDLEALGAELVVVHDFPVVTAYENEDLLPDCCPRRPGDWHSSERGPVIAHAWNEFLRLNQNPKTPDLASVDEMNIYPDSIRSTSEIKVFDKSNSIHFGKLVSYLHESPSLYDLEGLGQAVSALEGMRKILLEEWLTSLGCHCVVFPAAGDVAPADADVDDDHAAYAFRNGVLYSHGNRALRHLGVPSVSVPMGVMRHKHMPMNLTIAGKAYDDANLLRYANAYERATRRRVAPPYTPALETDTIASADLNGLQRAARPKLVVETCEAVSETAAVGSPSIRVTLEGHIAVPCPEGAWLSLIPEVEIAVESSTVPADQITIERQSQGMGVPALFRFRAWARTLNPSQRDERARTWEPVARDKIMVVILARSSAGGRPSGWLKLV